MINDRTLINTIKTQLTWIGKYLSNYWILIITVTSHEGTDMNSSQGTAIIKHEMVKKEPAEREEI